MIKTTAIVLAGGQGTRMKSPLPKVLHPVAGQPMIARIISQCQKAEIDEIRLVVGHGQNLVKTVVEPFGVSTFVQEKQLGTAGLEDAQMAKIKSLNIEHYFKKIFIIDSFLQKRKFDAFSAIISENDMQPENLLCIGNSLSSEIKDARLIGAWACYFAFGEDRGAYPTDPQLQPHFTVSSHSELIKTCRI